MMMMTISLTLISIILLIFNMMSKKMKFNKQKMYEFECGFNSISMTRIPFSTQFFLLTILFLIFDLEIAIILPISMEENFMFLNNINMNILMMSLMVGLMMEWMNGMMEWTK